MQRLFIDSTVLYMAARGRDSRALQLWKLGGVQLCTSEFDLQVARFNLETDAQRRRFSKLSEVIETFKPAKRELPKGIPLWKKDIPTVLAAIEARAHYLVTFNYTLPGRFSGKKIDGVQVITPARYLALEQGKAITPSVPGRQSASRSPSLLRTRRPRGE